MIDNTEQKEYIIHDGDFWVIGTKEPGDYMSGILISYFEPIVYSFVKVFLFGDKEMYGEDHDYIKPKEMLVDYVQRYCAKKITDELVAMQIIPEPVLGTYAGTEEYRIKLDTKDGYKYVYDRTESGAIRKAIPFLSNETLILILDQFTPYTVLPVYCDKGNPEWLMTEPEDDSEQIGYAVINLTELKQKLGDEKPATVLEEVLADSENTGEDFGCCLYVWDEPTQTWEMYGDNGEIYHGNDLQTNGMLDDLGWQLVDDLRKLPDDEAPYIDADLMK